MADKLDTLLADVQKHIADKKAELKAAETQLSALRSAQDDLNKEVLKSQDKLAAARAAMADQGNNLQRRKTEADNIAAGILNAAHKTRAQAEIIIRDAEVRAAEIVSEAQERARTIDAQITSRKSELQTITNEYNAAQSELAALKQQAREFADK